MRKGKKLFRYLAATKTLEKIAEKYTGKMGEVWRLKITAFKGTRSFSNSWRTDDTCIVCGVKTRLVNYFIDGKAYVCLTNDQSVSRGDESSGILFLRKFKI